MTDDELRNMIATQVKQSVEATNKPKFDATFNLGHILTLAGGCIAAFTFYISFHDSLLKSTNDIESNKKSITEIKETNLSLAKNQQSFASSLEKLTWIVDNLSKKP